MANGLAWLGLATKNRQEKETPYRRAMVAATRELGLTDFEDIDVCSVEMLGKVLKTMARRITDLEKATNG